VEPLKRAQDRPAAGYGGFTLVEVLISLAVIAFGCLAVSQMQISSMRGNSLANNMTIASVLVESEMERLKSLSAADFRDEVQAGNRQEGPLNRLGQTCPAGLDCSGYLFNRRISFFPEVPTVLSTQVLVEVTWTDSAGSHRVAYNTALTSLTF
jgi:prepilin-type N-terminal cleavage/methylation domain-containing protein